MARFVLISDTSLSHDYRNTPLLDFLASAPTSSLPGSIYHFLKGPAPPETGGRPLFAPYSLRKLEAALLRAYSHYEVAVAHEDHLEEFVDDDTELIGVTTMDPLGLGPLTMSYSVLFGTSAPAYVRKEFEELLARINRARAGKQRKPRLVVGGPGVWELTVRPEVLEAFSVDYAFQGEADDIAVDLFEYLSGDSSENTQFYRGFQTFDRSFHKQWVENEKFVSRYPFSRQFPKLEDIPEIANPSIKGMVEAMRGCGVGCDFCEVTLRPLRYCPVEKVQKEIAVNVAAGVDRVWLHSDEIFAYEHGADYAPNEDALVELMRGVMATHGVDRTNPTHGRISIPAAYPDLIARLSEIMRAGPDNWIGVQMGVETGSDRLAKMHMPNKTLPLKVGQDGTWQEIVLRGTRVMNTHYWRPAFTVQVGQSGETEEDNWETVALINKLSNSTLDDGRPFEFTVTPMQNVPLGHLKSREFSSLRLDQSQLAVYYASYRHLAKMAARNAFSSSGDPNPLARLATGLMVGLGSWGLFQIVSNICKKGGLDVAKAERHGLVASATPRPFGS